MSLVTKISSYFVRRKAEREQFKYDLYKVMVSLKGRPHNWLFKVPYKIVNEAEDMEIWVGNSYYGLSFDIKGRHYGGMHYLIGGEFLVPWRRKLYKVAWSCLDNPWMKKALY